VAEVEPRYGEDARTWLGSPSRLTRISYAIVRGTILLVAKLFGRVKVHGAEKLPETGAFVLAPVHRSNIDFALTSILTTRPMRYMGKDSIWKSRTLGRFVSMLGAFPVHRGSADRESLRACVEILEGGSPLVMFPEGTRKSGPIVEDLFDGTAYVASKTDVPIFPLGIGGSEAALPKGAKFLKRSQLVLTVGDPIPPPERSASGRVPRHAVHEMTVALGQRIQLLFDEAQAEAGQ
jgi:1-acyl-sn-glycerol-3-phosphate acyltransferase